MEEPNQDEFDFLSISSGSTYVIQHKPGLTRVQQDILKQYFDQYLNEGLSAFINYAPLEPMDLRPIRAFLIQCAYDTKPDYYTDLVNKYYKPLAENDPLYKQNHYFRELLFAFNKLCSGGVDINHPLYLSIFDPRLSTSKMNSPTKRNLVTKHLKKWTDPLIKDGIVVSSVDPVCIEARGFLYTLTSGIERSLSQDSRRKVSRVLFP